MKTPKQKIDEVLDRLGISGIKASSMMNIPHSTFRKNMMDSSKTYKFTDKNYSDLVDYLIDDYNSLSAVPIEVKSGKDYTVHSALNTFVQNEDYHIKKAFVVSNERKVQTKGKITYIPIYYIMFFNANSTLDNNIEF